MQFLEEVGQAVRPDKHRDAIHTSIIREYRRLKSRIPKDTGALTRSLLRRSDRAHVFEILDDKRINFGSKLPQAKYQSDRMPQPSPDNIAKGYLDAVWDSLGGG